jgi:hypothetical protein
MATTLLKNQNKKPYHWNQKIIMECLLTFFSTLMGGKKAHQLVFAFMNLLFSLVKINLS